MSKAGFYYQLTNILNIATQLIIQDCHYQKTSHMPPFLKK